MKTKNERPTTFTFHAERSGMTLLEMTVVILVLMSLVFVMFFGARGWKRGSDRAICIMQIHRVQKGLRSYANLYDFAPGAHAPGLLNHIIGLGRYVEAPPICPSGGSYAYGVEYGQETIPPIGEVYAECSLAVSSEHAPQHTEDW